MTTSTKTPNKKKSGRKKNSNFIPYNEAREFVQTECISSRTQFEAWWQTNKPKVIPRFPYRVYQKEWTTWNDFLGLNNKFGKEKKNYRAYDEAVLWVHKLGVETMEKWFEYCRAEDSNLPTDIPARPDIVYKKHWRSWGHWLGNKPVEKIEAAQQAQRVALFYIVKERGTVGNVYTYGMEPNGVSALKQRWEREQFQVVKLFWYDPTKGSEVQKIINGLTSPYLESSTSRLTPNVFDVIWHLQKVLDTVS